MVIPQQPSPHLRRFPALLVLLTLAWGGAAALASEPPQHVLLITADTLRADALTPYNEAKRTPQISELAAEGVVFDDVLTTIGKTGPAISSLFTSHYPPSHGARRNGIPMRQDLPTLAGVLSEHGFSTAAFISNWTLRSNLSGNHRGFDHYDQEFTHKRYGVGRMAEREASDVVTSAVEFYAGDKGASSTTERRFLWIHFSEPHSPYELHRGHIPRPEDASPASRKRQAYASEVRLVDHWTGRALERLAPWFPPDQTLVIFTADHGESLGEHDYWGHGKNTHWPNLQIPLVLRGPGLPAGQRRNAPASILDVLPTTLGLLGIEAPGELEGVDLTEVATGGHHQLDKRTRHAFADRGAALSTSAATGDPLEIAQVVGQRGAGAIKTVYDFTSRTVAHYDLDRDPGETEPLRRAPIEVEPPLRRQLASWYRGLSTFEHDERNTLSDADRNELEALGYIEPSEGR